MSTLDELIQALCPDGTEFRKLIEVSDILYGYPCDASKFNEDMNGMPLVRIRDVLAGETSTFTTEIVPDDYIVHAGDLLVGMDGNFHVSAWKMGDAILCQRVCKVSSKDENVVKSSFLKHLLPPIIKSIEQGKQSGTVKHLLAKDINAIRIPLPPLPVQQEIVRILDSFTQLTAELTAELTARRKQYEHYKAKIFEDAIKHGKTVLLGEIATFSQGIQIEPSNQYSEMRPGRVRFLRIVDFVSPNNEPPRYIECPDSKYLKAEDELIMIRYGASAAGKVFLSYSGAIANNMFKINLADSILPRYMMHYLSQQSIYTALNSSGGKSTMPSVNFKLVGKITVPVVSMSMQKQIVDTLDRFDILCNDLISGLPAEIEARQKQYEYYRDKLLNFKELGA